MVTFTESLPLGTKVAAVADTLDQHCVAGESDACFLAGVLIDPHSDFTGVLPGPVIEEIGSTKLPDRERSRRYYEMACKNGTPFACGILANRIAFSSDVGAVLPEDQIGEATALYQKACSAGVALSCSAANELLMDRFPGFLDMPPALRAAFDDMALTGCEMADPTSCFSSAFSRLERLNVGPSRSDWPDYEYATLMDELWTACLGSHALGCGFYADISVREDYPRSLSEPSQEFTRELQAATFSCEAQLGIGCTALGYSHTRSVPPNYDIASTSFSKACDLNEPRGCAAHISLVEFNQVGTITQDQMDFVCDAAPEVAQKYDLKCERLQ